jgi:ferredoxin-thioredoxin reductase catalytic subunit
MDLRRELIDFTKWLVENRRYHILKDEETTVDIYLKSINLKALNESRNISKNEHQKNFFNCPNCNKLLELKEGIHCECGMLLKSFTIEE